MFSLNVAKWLLILFLSVFLGGLAAADGVTQDFWEQGALDHHIEEDDGSGPTFDRSFCGSPPSGEEGCALYQNTEGDAGNRDRNRMVATWNIQMDLTGAENLSFRRQILQHDRHAIMGVIVDHDGDAEDAWNSRGDDSDYYEDPEDYTDGNTWNEEPSSDEIDGDGEWQDGRVVIDVSNYSGLTGVTLYSGHSMYWYETADSEFWAYDLQVDGDLLPRICDAKGPREECISNTTHDISGEEFDIENEFISKPRGFFQASETAKLNLTNTTSLSGAWHGSFNILTDENHKTRITAGADFRPGDGRITIN